MQSKKRTLLLALGIFSIAFSCSTKKGSEHQTSEGSKEVENVDFVPNPQVISEVNIEPLEIGSQAPNFELPGVDNRFYTLESFADARVLVIIFTCNHCPTAQAYEDRIIDIVNDYKDKSVQVVAISPNAVNALLLEELGYSDLGDSFQEMQIRAKDKGYNFPYLYDGDAQEASIKYGPTATPHAFVFDSDRKLRYKGRLDSSEKPGSASAEDLRAAIDATLTNADISNPVTKTFGCSIKWGWKTSWTEKVNTDWANMAVSLANINAEEVRDLMQNDSGKLRLINIWATWCGPCVIEYPEFINIHRMYKGRDFEFISLSADKIEQREKVLKFLENKESAVQNFIYTGDDLYQLIEAVDPEWDGALPYTVLLEPGGQKVYESMGTIEPLELKRIIVEHPMIGRYY